MDTATMTPADLAAIMGNENGFGGNNGISWLILLFLFMGWNRGGYGGYGGQYGQYATAASQQDILFGQKFGDLDNKIDRLGNGIADATFALKDTIGAVGGQVNAQGRALQGQLAECCCENRLAIANLGAQTDQQTAAIVQAINCDGEKTRALLQANEMQNLRDKVASLEMDNRMCGVVRYPMTYAYSAGQSPFCGCNCGGNINI